nr:MMPL family transporter [Actinomycetes bacterium]
DTGQVVTSAAAIMVVVFASFILVPDPVVKMFGVGLATAVLVDATIVRCMLVPALMVLAAKWTWWLPKWLDRALPELNVEGDPAALDTINEDPPDQSPKTVREATRPSTKMIPIAIGIIIAWIVSSRFNANSPVMPFQDVAIAVSAIVGGIVVWLPAGMPGAGRSRGLRILMILIGAGIVAIFFSLLRTIILATEQVPGQMAAWSILALALIVAFTPLRRYGLALVLGGITMAVTFGVGAAEIDADYGVLLRNALLPAFLAGFLAVLIDRLITRPAPPETEPIEPETPQPTEPASELSSAGSSR